MRKLVAAALLNLSLPFAAQADSMKLAPVQVTEWKAVYGRIEARDRIPARARLGGSLTKIRVAEGDLVAAGDVLAMVVDAKLGFRLAAIDAQREAILAQQANARTELQRGEDLLKQGVTTLQRLDALRTQVEVLAGQLAAIDADRRVLEQQVAEGAVLAPVAGRVLEVPVAPGEVVLPGEAMVTLGGGGIFLRLAVPERFAGRLKPGETILIDGAGGATEGRLARIYPLIENGRVIADVEVAGLSDAFVDARVLVRLPVAERAALLVPQTALLTQSGLDFVGIDGGALRAVVPGQTHRIDGVAMVEILSGLQAGDLVLTTAPAAGAGHD